MREFGGAVGAEFVVIGHFVLARGASRVQIVFAIGTEVEASIHGGGALWTSVGQRLAHEQIDDQSDEEVAARKNKNQ